MAFDFNTPKGEDPFIKPDGDFSRWSVVSDEVEGFFMRPDVSQYLHALDQETKRLLHDVIISEVQVKVRAVLGERSKLYEMIGSGMSYSELRSNGMAPDNSVNASNRELGKKVITQLILMDIREQIDVAFERALKELKIYQLENELPSDRLTGALNRDVFFERLEGYINEFGKQMPNGRKQMSVIIFDIDHFLRVNENFGLETGDYVLTEIAGRVKKYFEGNNSKKYEFSRLDGEEFAILLPEKGGDEACSIAHNLRISVFSKPFITEKYNGDDSGIEISATFGISEFKGYDFSRRRIIINDTNGEDFIRNARSQLLIGKGNSPDIRGRKRNRRGQIIYNGSAVPVGRYG